MKPGVPRSTRNNLRKHKILWEAYSQTSLPALFTHEIYFSSTYIVQALTTRSTKNCFPWACCVSIAHVCQTASSVSKLQLCSCYNCKYLRYFSTGSRPIQFQEHGISPLHSLKWSHHRFPKQTVINTLLIFTEECEYF